MFNELATGNDIEMFFLSPTCLIDQGASCVSFNVTLSFLCNINMILPCPPQGQ